MAGGAVDFASAQIPGLVRSARPVAPALWPPCGCLTRCILARMDTLSAEHGPTTGHRPGPAPALLGVVALGATYGVTQSWIAALAAAVASAAAVHATLKARTRRG
jgi:hypothetical protein